MTELLNRLRPENSFDSLVAVSLVVTLATFVNAAWDVNRNVFAVTGLLMFLLPVVGTAIVYRYETQKIYEEFKHWAKMAVVGYLFGILAVLMDVPYPGSISEMGFTWASVMAVMFVTFWATGACVIAYVIHSVQEWRKGRKSDEEILDEVLDDDDDDDD